MFVSSFEAEEKTFRQKKTTIAIVATVVFHALILLFLIYKILETPNPPFEENGGGMTVNLGFDDAGTGDEQPMSYNPGPMQSAPASAAASAPQQNTEDPVMTEDNNENDVVVKEVEEKPVKKQEQKVDPKTQFKPTTKTNPANNTSNKPTTTTTEPKQVADPNALFPPGGGAKDKPNKSTSDGTGGGNGDQGNPNGDPNSRNYTGNGGDGSGPGKGDLNGGYSLAGRSKVNIPLPGKCSLPGKVVVKINVNREGKVVSAEPNRLVSTAKDDCNISNALNAARKAVFSPDSDPNRAEIQTGTITYIFQVK
jgi:outer membrane biosynthesis protein TonB